jgi:hypothetical protein
MGPEEITQLLGHDLAHDALLRQRFLDVIAQGSDSTCTNTHSITFDHGGQRVSVVYELSNEAPVEFSLASFVDFVRSSTTCTTKGCRRCAASRGEALPGKAPTRGKRGGR